MIIIIKNNESKLFGFDSFIFIWFLFIEETFCINSLLLQVYSTDQAANITPRIYFIIEWTLYEIKYKKLIKLFMYYTNESKTKIIPVFEINPFV